MLTPILATDDPYLAAASFAEVQPWGERAFSAVIVGYRFLIAAETTA